MVGVHLGQGDDREHAENQDLGAQQELLDARRELDPAVADPRHHGDPQHGRGHDRGGRFGEFCETEELERIDAGDVRQRGHHEHVGQKDRPAVHPSDPRSESARRPGECRARVGVSPVQAPIGAGDQQHRHERDEQDRRRVYPHPLNRHDESERRRQRIGRRRRGDADDQVREVADRVFLQALVHHLARRFEVWFPGGADTGHGANPLCRRPPVAGRPRRSSCDRYKQSEARLGRLRRKHKGRNRQQVAIRLSI